MCRSFPHGEEDHLLAPVVERPSVVVAQEADGAKARARKQVLELEAVEPAPAHGRVVAAELALSTVLVPEVVQVHHLHLIQKVQEQLAKEH